MRISGFAKEVSPEFPSGGHVDCGIQEVSFFLRDFGCELDGRVYTVEESYEAVQG